MGHINGDVKLRLVIDELRSIIQFLLLQNVRDNVIPIYCCAKHNPILCQNTVPVENIEVSVWRGSLSLLDPR